MALTERYCQPEYTWLKVGLAEDCIRVYLVPKALIICHILYLAEGRDLKE